MGWTGDGADRDAFVVLLANRLSCMQGVAGKLQSSAARQSGAHAQSLGIHDAAKICKSANLEA